MNTKQRIAAITSFALFVVVAASSGVLAQKGATDSQGPAPQAPQVATTRARTATSLLMGSWTRIYYYGESATAVITMNLTISPDGTWKHLATLAPSLTGPDKNPTKPTETSGRWQLQAGKLLFTPALSAKANKDPDSVTIWQITNITEPIMWIQENNPGMNAASASWNKEERWYRE
jgi:hypothetical protein